MENTFVLYQKLLAALRPRYDTGEARAVALLVLEEAFGWNRTDVYAGKIKTFSPEQAERFRQILQRLADGEPVQYVLGHARFLGHIFSVRKGVLIPRPETEELVEWIVADFKDISALRIVDCGTGSGCIAVSLKLLLPQAEVEGWDTSPEALATAQENDRNLRAGVTFRHKDMAQLPAESHRFDVAVSNPPYVRRAEQETMDERVTGHEPHEALFVPDEDPLVHYRQLAASRLPLYLEINASLAQETLQLLKESGYKDLVLRRDQFGLPRMIRARL